VAARGTTTPGSADLGGEQVEGFHAVRELLRARRRAVREVWTVERDGGGGEIAKLAASAGVRVRLVTAAQLEERARSEAPQGLVAFAAPVPIAPVHDLVGASDAFLVVVDGITDPGNLGAILRTAETAGVTGVVLPRHRAARLGPAALKAAAGAAEYVPITAVAGVPGFLEQARRAGVWTVGLDGDGTADVGELAVADAPVAIVLGAEGRGLARLTRERCDVLAAIPMYGRLESLNVSAAAAIALHAVARRRHAGGPPTRL
jgi:23S rRNA (guanosine2251-2'-O)-methyltransferase